MKNKKSKYINIKRIIILTQYFAPEPGAPQIRLMEMSKYMISKGIDVEVITGFPNYPDGVLHEGYSKRYFMKDNINGISIKRSWIYPAAGKNILKRLLNYFSFIISSLIPLFSSKKPDLIFVEAQPIILGIPAYFYKLLRGVPYIYNTPDLQIEYAEEDHWVGFKMIIKLAKSIERKLMENALSVTTVTHAFIKHFIKHRGIAPSKMSFLPNGADTDILRPLNKDENLLNRFQLNDKKIFTFAGTHAPYQGLETIVYAAEILRDRDDIAILMVGKGPVRNTLILKAKSIGLNNIHFQDSPFNEMPILMSITYASLVVLRDLPMTRKMRLSKTIPPISCGVPVIYGGFGETADILKNNNAGIVTDPEDSNKLAAAIIKIADDLNLRKEMSKNCRKLALRDFSWRNIVESWLLQIKAIQQGENPKKFYASIEGE
jgi:colanic acid biosynthesis glycosyl transferase WcaI